MAVSGCFLIYPPTPLRALFLHPLLVLPGGLYLYAAIEAALIVRREKTVERPRAKRWVAYGLILATGSTANYFITTYARHGHSPSHSPPSSAARIGEQLMRNPAAER